MEMWKDIKGYEGLYQISNYGRLKSFKRFTQGKVLKLTNRKNTYFSVVLQGKGKKRRSVRIHRLVAEAFIPNPENLPEINHIDGNKQNNYTNNLEWCSRKQNIAHSLKMHPEQLKGMICYNQRTRPKRIVQQDLNGNTLAVFDSAESASRETGVCARNILAVANKTPFNEKGQFRKTAGGYKWAFESVVI